MLSKLTLRDYQNITDQHEWTESDQALPPSFLALIHTAPNTTIGELLKEIRRALNQTYGDSTVKPTSFTESRFTSATEAIERHLAACGINTNIFGTALRHFGVPVQYVHGKLARFPQDSDNRHAWLKIYNPLTGEWITCDPGRPKFDMEDDAIEVKIYHDWQELKPDYEKGEY